MGVTEDAEIKADEGDPPRLSSASGQSPLCVKIEFSVGVRGDDSAIMMVVIDESHSAL
jgi:hypothetical protein